GRGTAEDLKLALRDPSLRVHVFAAEALTKIGVEKAAAEAVLRGGWGEVLALSNPRLLQSEVGGLVRLSIDDLPKLRALLFSPDVHVRSASTEALEELGPRAARALPLLLPEIHQEGFLNPERSRAPPLEGTWTVLQTIGPAAAVAAPELERYLKSTERYVR